MSSVIRQETAVFLIFILHGAALTFQYDLLRALRRSVRHSLIVLSAEDFLFWLLAGFLTFYVAFRETDGRIRGYTAAGILLGFLLYHFTVSRVVVAFFTRLFRLLLQAFAALLHALRTILRFARRILYAAFCSVRHILRIVSAPLRRILSTPVKTICGFCKKRTDFKKNCRFCKKRIEFTRKSDYNRKKDSRGVNQKG